MPHVANHVAKVLSHFRPLRRLQLAEWWMHSRDDPEPPGLYDPIVVELEQLNRRTPVGR